MKKNSADHPILVEIWKILRQKENVALFLETDNMEEDSEIILNWFEPITEAKLSGEDAEMKNGAFLCIRRVIAEMPPINKSTQGEYKVKVITKKQLAELVESLND